MKLPDIEVVSAQVHEAWMQSKRAQGVESRKAEDGEELMAPYSTLSEKEKELDRGTVRAVFAAIAACSDAENKAISARFDGMERAQYGFGEALAAQPKDPAPGPSTQALAAGAFYPQVTGYATHAAELMEAPAVAVPVESAEYHHPQMEHWAEDRECAMMCLDDANVPRSDDTGMVYSLWGRIKIFASTTQRAEQGDAQDAERLDYKARYEELLYAVGNKWPGESRHETALKYIQRAETSSGLASQVSTAAILSSKPTTAEVKS